MEKWVKDWCRDTKKDTIEGLWFLSAFVPMIYYIFSSPSRTINIMTIMASKDIITIACLCLGVFVLSFWLGKALRFSLGIIWFILTPIRLYISKKFN